MSMATNLAVFFLLINLSAGILGVALHDQTGGNLGIGVDYSATQTQNSVQNLNGSVIVPGADSNTNWGFSILNIVSLGFWSKVQGFLDSTVFGIIGLFKSLSILGGGFNDYAGYFYTVVTIIYFIGIIDLFTGKRVAGR